MGVPSYFHWLIKRFEDEILKPCSEPNHLDKLYLDLNCAIHPAVKEPGLSRSGMYHAVGEYLDNILQVANPQKLVYIAIDGVAPSAKMSQQRKRRYKSIQDATHIDAIKQKFNIPTEKGEDFNMISPGTEFMSELSTYLKAKIKALIHNNPGITYIFSDASVPGEGEHKIMDHIRKSPSPQRTQNESIAIYGLDADLIFLCLANHRKDVNMYLLREVVHFGPKFKCSKAENLKFVYLSIEALRECLLKILNPYVSLRELENFGIFEEYTYDDYTRNKSETKPEAKPDPNEIASEPVVVVLNEIDPKNKQPENKSENEYDKSFTEHCHEMMRIRFYSSKEEEQNLIMDYIFLSFMLGNDFLPALPSLKIKEGGLDQLLRVYKMVQMQQKNYLIGTGQDKTYYVNIEFLRELLNQLSLLEDPMLQHRTKVRNHRVNNFYRSRDYTSATPYEQALMEFEYVENSGDPIQLGYSGWRNRYYYHHFIIENRNTHEFKKNVQDICQNFLEGMMWTLRYYSQGCPNWEWNYEYHSSPTVTDLHESLKKLNPNKLQINNQSQPVTPFFQLMCILPPGSSKLLPKPLADLMTNPDSPISYLYPKNFELDTLSQRFRWECHPLLPSINRKQLQNMLLQIEKFLTVEETVRNKNSASLEV